MVANMGARKTASAPMRAARAHADRECAAQVSIQSGRRTCQRAARASFCSGKCAPCAPDFAARAGSSAMIHRRSRVRAMREIERASAMRRAGSRARRTTRLPRGRAEIEASGSVIRSSSVSRTRPGSEELDRTANARAALANCNRARLSTTQCPRRLLRPIHQPRETWRTFLRASTRRERLPSLLPLRPRWSQFQRLSRPNRSVPCSLLVTAFSVRTACRKPKQSGPS